MHTEKICKNCDQKKELALFGSDKRTPDGREGVCKDCRNRARRNRANHESNISRRSHRVTKIKIHPEEELVSIPAKSITIVESKQQPVEFSPKDVVMIEQIKKKHNCHFSISSHPHLDGFVVQLQKPRVHKEGKNLLEMLEEVFATPAELEAL